MKVRYKNMSQATKAEICKEYLQDECVLCPLRIFFGHSIVCLRDLDKVIKVDLSIELGDFKDERLGSSRKTKETS